MAKPSEDRRPIPGLVKPAPTKRPRGVKLRAATVILSRLKFLKIKIL